MAHGRARRPAEPPCRALACVRCRAVCVLRLCALPPHRVADNAPTVLSLADRGTGAAIRAAPQSKDCVRARLARAAAPLRKGRSAGRARYPPRLARLRPARSAAPPFRQRESALLPRCAIHPRMRGSWLGRDTSRRPAPPHRGVCRTSAADSLWPHGRSAVSLVRCRHMPFDTAQAFPLAPTDEPHTSEAHTWHAERDSATNPKRAGREARRCA